MLRGNGRGYGRVASRESRVAGTQSELDDVRKYREGSLANTDSLRSEAEVGAAGSASLAPTLAEPPEPPELPEQDPEHRRRELAAYVEELQEEFERLAGDMPLETAYRFGQRIAEAAKSTAPPDRRPALEPASRPGGS